MPWMAFVIELPTFAVIGWLFARGRPARYTAPLLAGSLLLALVVTIWAFGLADRSHGPMWPQVLAALAGYGVFLLAMTLGWLLPFLAARSAAGSRGRNLTR